MGFQTVSPQTIDHSLPVTSFRSLQQSISLNTLKLHHDTCNSTARWRTVLKQQRTSWRELLMLAMTITCLYWTLGTPQRDGRHSCPASLHRQNQHFLLMVNHLLHPKVISNVKLTLQQRRHKQPIYCDRGAKDSKSEMWCVGSTFTMLLKVL